MAVGDIHIPQMQAVKGLKIGSTEAYVRYPNRRDLVIFEFSEGTHVAGIFTQNAFCAAPVHVSKKHLSHANIRYLIINTGNANAGTGEEGMHNAYAMCEAVAKETGVQTEQVLPFSTGVIGEQLPIQRITSAISPALDSLKDDAWLDAAHGIMTTDTIPKGESITIDLDGLSYSMTGISKGAGMIRPNMATMLSFIVTDIPISKSLVQKLLQNAADQSFNRITVDGDTSTNDSCIFAATGQGGGQEIQTETDPRYAVVRDKLFEVMKRLAQLIVRDGEGATKFITIDVKGGKNTQECCDVAYSIAHSPLVKTAIFASDPNWGRILCAIGYAHISELDVTKVQVWLDEVQICKNGGRAQTYSEEAGISVMSKPELTIHVDLGRGDAQDIVYTCDLSYDYVKINADYRS